MIDSEIIKALECHMAAADDTVCDNCPYRDCGCSFTLCSVVFDLINRQQAEIDANEKIIKAFNDSIKTYRSEVQKLVINVRTEAIKDVLDEITEILHEAEMHGNYEPSLTIEIINDIKKKMGADNG